MVSTAVQRGYAVVTVGPHLSGASDRCWTKTWPPEASIEIPEVRHTHVCTLVSNLVHLYPNPARRKEACKEPVCACWLH